MSLHCCLLLLRHRQSSRRRRRLPPSSPTPAWDTSNNHTSKQWFISVTSDFLLFVNRHKFTAVHDNCCPCAMEDPRWWVLAWERITRTMNVECTKGVAMTFPNSLPFNTFYSSVPHANSFSYLCHETKRNEPPPQSPLLVTLLVCGRVEIWNQEASTL